MATIRERKRKKGVVYMAEVYVGGVRRAATFDKKSEAHAWAEEAENLLRAGKPLPGELPNGDMPIETAINRYLLHLENSKRKDATKRMYRQCAERIINAFPDQTVLGLQRRDVARYRDKRLQTVGPASIRHDFVSSF